MRGSPSPMFAVRRAVRRADRGVVRRVQRACGEPRAFLANSSAPDSDFQELLHRARHLVVFSKASAQLVGNIDRDVARPALGGVEGDNADGVTILVFHETAHQRLPVSALLICFAPSAPEPAKIV